LVMVAVRKCANISWRLDVAPGKRLGLQVGNGCVRNAAVIECK
jgi:hypothetical protein